MTTHANPIENFEDLKSAIYSGEKNIFIKRSFVCTHAITLPESANLKGIRQENGELPLLTFINSDGIGVASNNTIKELNIDVPAQNKAIYTTLKNTISAH